MDIQPFLVKRDELRADDTGLTVIVWTILLINTSASILKVHTIWVNLCQQYSHDCRWCVVMIHCTTGIILLSTGSYLAFAKNETGLMIFATLVLIVSVIVIFVQDFLKMYLPIDFALYTLCGILAFIEAYLLSYIDWKVQTYLSDPRLTGMTSK